MLKYTKIAVLVLMPCLAGAQSVSVDPHSFVAWGELKASTMVSAEYKIIGLHYIHVWDTQYSPVGNAPTSKNTFGISLTTPRVLDIVRGGIMYFTENFPTPTDTRLNAFVEASYSIEHKIRIHYRHISNAGFGKTNHGIDYVGLAYHF